MSAREFALLHHLRIRGRVAQDRVDAVALAAAAEAGLVRITPRGVTLTGPGLAKHRVLLTADLESADQSVVERTYDRFLAVNVDVKAACAQWQAAGATADDDVLNATVDRLERAYHRIDRPMATLGAALPRFEGYRARLGSTLDAASAGAREQVASPIEDSFHTAWFECHEDFLLTLGRDREADDR
ncbi:MAG: hypothetical protein QM662_17995 [Gordonia sp. (in: high G+C Gram-positive bacteria)]